MGKKKENKKNTISGKDKQQEDSNLAKSSSDSRNNGDSIGLLLKAIDEIEKNKDKDANNSSLNVNVNAAKKNRNRKRYRKDISGTLTKNQEKNKEKKDEKIENSKNGLNQFSSKTVSLSDNLNQDPSDIIGVQYKGLLLKNNNTSNSGLVNNGNNSKNDTLSTSSKCSSMFPNNKKRKIVKDISIVTEKNNSFTITKADDFNKQSGTIFLSPPNLNKISQNIINLNNINGDEITDKDFTTGGLIKRDSSSYSNLPYFTNLVRSVIDDYNNGGDQNKKDGSMVICRVEFRITLSFKEGKKYVVSLAVNAKNEPTSSCKKYFSSEEKNKERKDFLLTLIDKVRDKSEQNNLNKFEGEVEVDIVASVPTTDFHPKKEYTHDKISAEYFQEIFRTMRVLVKKIDKSPAFNFYYIVLNCIKDSDVTVRIKIADSRYNSIVENVNGKVMSEETLKGVIENIFLSFDLIPVQISVLKGENIVRIFYAKTPQDKQKINNVLADLNCLNCDVDEKQLKEVSSGSLPFSNSFSCNNSNNNNNFNFNGENIENKNKNEKINIQQNNFVSNNIYFNNYNNFFLNNQNINSSNLNQKKEQNSL